MVITLGANGVTVSEEPDAGEVPAEIGWNWPRAREEAA